MYILFDCKVKSDVRASHRSSRTKQKRRQSPLKIMDNFSLSLIIKEGKNRKERFWNTVNKETNKKTNKPTNKSYNTMKSVEETHKLKHCLVT